MVRSFFKGQNSFIFIILKEPTVNNIYTGYKWYMSIRNVHYVDRYIPSAWPSEWKGKEAIASPDLGIDKNKTLAIKRPRSISYPTWFLDLPTSLFWVNQEKVYEEKGFPDHLLERGLATPHKSPGWLMPSCRDGETPFWSFAIYFNCSSLIEASEINSERMGKASRRALA